MLNYAAECRDLGIPFAYDPSQQTARLSGEDLRNSIPGARWLLVNDYEMAVIEEKTAGRGKRFTSKWAHSSLRRPGRQSHLPLRRRISHTSGGAPKGGRAYRCWRRLPRRLLCRAQRRPAGRHVRRVGAMCATYALEQVGTTNHSFTPQEFALRYQQAFGEELLWGEPA